MCLRARSRSVFTSVKNGFDFAFFLATEVTPEGRDSAPVFIHRRAGFSENIRTWLRQILSQATVSNSPTYGAYPKAASSAAIKGPSLGGLASNAGSMP